jgi:hypothetical protein
VAAVPRLSAVATSCGPPTQTVDTGGRVFRAYATYATLIVTVLIGQIGNFAGLRPCGRQPTSPRC